MVDKSSSDNTLEIVQNSGVEFEVREWQGFAGTKKYALSRVKNDWVLWVDSDEVLTVGLQEELKRLKEGEPEFPVYKVARRAYFLGKWIKHGGWYPGYVARLFNKSIVNFNDNDVHEGLDYKGNAGILKNDLEHFTDLSIKHYYEKFNNYTSLAASELEKKGRKFKAIDLLLHPAFFFFKMYILRLGFLDGIQGLILAVFSTNYVFTKYAKFWELKGKK